ncbi:MAG: hypothetical protein DDT41_01757 [candidate division WS2 bacterium]|nr:hypothetical protein [Candidatus Psychracetigena formicireducens]
MGILLKEWLESRWRFYIGLIVFSLFSLLNVVLYPWLKTLITPEFISTMELILEQMPFITPEQVQGAINLNWNAYLYGSWISKTLYQGMAIYLLFMAAPLLASEESRGTLEFLIAKPISSFSIITAKYSVSLIETIIVAIFSTLILYPASLYMREVFNFSLFFGGLIQSIAGIAFLFSVAFSISSLCKDQVKAIAFSALAYIALSLPSFLPKYHHLSIFRFMQGINILNQEPILWGTIFLLLAASLILMLIANYIFEKKEI